MATIRHANEAGKVDIETLLRDPSTSHWLKHALRSALERDALDAARDADLLAELLEDRVADLLATPLMHKGGAR